MNVAELIEYLKQLPPDASVETIVDQGGEFYQQMGFVPLTNDQLYYTSSKNVLEIGG